MLDIENEEVKFASEIRLYIRVAEWPQIAYVIITRVTKNQLGVKLHNLCGSESVHTLSNKKLLNVIIASEAMTLYYDERERERQ